MERRPEELDINESYRFGVTVDNNGSRFAGELRLSPDGCSLVVRGDISEGRTQNFDFEGADELTCDSSEGAFYLYGLRGKKGWTGVLQRHPKSVSHFEFEYEVSHVLYDRIRSYRNPTYLGIDFQSSSIAKWVGYTHTQEEIVAKYHDGTLFPYDNESYTEFIQAIPGLGKIAAAYYPRSQYSVDDFSMGLQFEPVLSIVFDAPRTGAEVIEIVSEIDNLFSFLLGESINFERIKLISSNGRIHPFYLYFSRSSNKNNCNTPLFPLGMNLRIDHFGLPALPVESLSTYFQLNESDRLHFKKYVKYRSLENPEERLLGFFRLLEKLCFHKESFLPEENLVALLKRFKPRLIRYFDDKKNVERVLDRMIGWNNSKLNTAGCITRFMKNIPSSLIKRWIYSSKSINDICKLRNDLTHANEVEPETREIGQIAKFVEVLLVIRLLIVLGVSMEQAASIAPRIQGHVLIEKRAQIQVTSIGA